MDADRGRRIRALDGLRGLAAVVVLLSHVVDGGWGALSETITLGGVPPGRSSLLWRTPLATVWAGPELVIVFFVLSGFVLTRALAARPLSLRSFYGGRLVRLYLPAWLALLPAAALVALVPRVATGGAGVGFWLDTYAVAPSLAQVGRDLALILPQPGGQLDGTLDGVLWSLRWEVWFSLALPFLLLAAPRLRRHAPLVVAAVLVSVAVGRRDTFLFLPPFVLGVLLALHADTLARWRLRLAGRGAAAAVVVVAALLSADVWLPGATRARGEGGVLVAVAAAGAVMLPLLYRSVERRLEGRVLQWLGSRSFSLYLIHHPIVLAFAYGLHRPSFLVLLACVLPSSLVAAEAFHRGVERPAHRLSRAAIGQLEGRAARRPTHRAHPSPA